VVRRRKEIDEMDRELKAVYDEAVELAIKNWMKEEAEGKRLPVRRSKPRAVVVLHSTKREAPQHRNGATEHMSKSGGSFAAAGCAEGFNRCGWGWGLSKRDRCGALALREAVGGERRRKRWRALLRWS